MTMLVARRCSSLRAPSVMISSLRRLSLVRGRLREELRRASSGDRIDTLRGEILELLDGDDTGMRGQSRLLDRTVGELRKLDEGAASLAERISALAIEIDDLARDVAGRGAAEAPPRPVAEIEERLGLILSLERRFRTDEAGLAEALERAAAEVHRLEGAATRRGRSPRSVPNLRCRSARWR